MIATILSGAAAVLAAGAWLRERRARLRQAASVAETLRSLAGPQPASDGIAALFHACAVEQTRLRSAAREAEDHLRAILASMAEGVLVVDHRRVIQLVNPSLLKLFGLKQDPAGQTVLSALRLPLLESMIRTAMQERTPQQEETTVQLVPGQSPVHLIISTLPLREEAEQPGAVTVIRDISPLRQVEEMRREFVANVSHELRTPLAIFHGYLETLLDRPGMPEAEMTPILKVMDKHSARLNALVEDLLTLTRLESRREPPARESVDLAECFRSVAADWAARCAPKNVVIEVDVPGGVPTLSVDPLRLRQVLDNLLDNALKYSPPGGAIHLRAIRAGEAIEISVEDHGAGIPPADLPHIFERFYRADKARSRDVGGTGLGLSIVKHIVLAHDGGVAGQSTYGAGTTIILTFPQVSRSEEG